MLLLMVEFIIPMQPKKGFDYRLIIHTRPRTYQKDLKFMSGNKAKFAEMIAKAAAKHQMDPKLLHAVIQAESAYNPMRFLLRGLSA